MASEVILVDGSTTIPTLHSRDLDLRDPEIDHAVTALMQAGEEKLLTILGEAAKQGLLGALMTLAEVVNIMTTLPLQANQKRLQALKKSVRAAPYKWWLEQGGYKNTTSSILDWWSLITQMVAATEQAIVGGIDDQVQGGTNLWPASRELALKMEEPGRSRRYGGLRAADINNPNQVERVLRNGVVPEAEAFLEIFVGQTTEDLLKHVPELLNAMHVSVSADGTPFDPLEGCVFTILAAMSDKT